MDDLLLHPHSREQLERFIKQPSHALMLLAPDGSGKRSVAEVVARQILDIKDSKNLREHPAINYVEPDNRAIPIEAIRLLQKRLQLKTIGTRPIRRIVIIEGAHRMTTEAQNALLKMLEEPPADTLFILTATSKHSVLPTIYSRSQHIEVKSPSSTDMVDYFKGLGLASEAIQSALRYSGGRIGLTHALLQKDEEHPLLAAVVQARQLLSASLFEKLGLVDDWAKHKDELSDRLDTLERMCQAGLSAAADKEDNDLVKRWKRYYQAVYDAKASLRHTPNAKLLLTNLFLSLS